MTTAVTVEHGIVPNQDNVEYFPSVPNKIKYKGADSNDHLSFRYYNPDELILGKPMKEWLRFSVCYWHTFCWDGKFFFVQMI